MSAGATDWRLGSLETPLSKSRKRLARVGRGSFEPVDGDGDEEDDDDDGGEAADRD